MKELSIEEKAKAYDEASKWMEGIYPTLTHEQQGEAEMFFPMFKDSEDERYRKWILEYLYVGLRRSDEQFKDRYKAAISWFEKQGEKEKFIKKELNCIKGYRDEAIRRLNKLKPRYNIGDVLCDKSCTTLNKDAQPNFEIVDIKDGVYICDNGSIPISQQDNFELVAKKIEQNTAWSEKDSVMLGDLVFSINEESIIEGLKRRGIDCNLDTAACLKERLIAWIKTFKDRVQPQPKSAWSEEDEKMYKTVHNLAWEAYKRHRQLDIPTFGTINHWFKALKDRAILQSKLRWEPSDEEMANSFLHKLEVCDLLSMKEDRWFKDKLKLLRDNHNL